MTPEPLFLPDEALSLTGKVNQAYENLMTIIADDAASLERLYIELTNMAEKAAKKRKPRKVEMTFAQYRQQCEREGKPMISLESEAFTYARSIDLDLQFVRLAWEEFKHVYEPTKKRQKDWPKHFANCIRRNWFKLWYYDNRTNTYALTSIGQQQTRFHQAQAAQQRKTA